MKKRIIISLVLVFVFVLALASSGTMSAKSVRTEFSQVEYDCFTGFTEDGGVWEDPDGMTHMRGVLHSNIAMSETPEFDGIHHTVADAEFNNKTGFAIIRGTSNFIPNTIDGAWVGHWVFIGNKNHGYGWGVWHGTGALSGRVARMDVYDAPEVVEIEGICDSVGGVYEAAVKTEGMMLEAGPERALPVEVLDLSR